MPGLYFVLYSRCWEYERNIGCFNQKEITRCTFIGRQNEASSVTKAKCPQIPMDMKWKLDQALPALRYKKMKHVPACDGPVAYE